MKVLLIGSGGREHALAWAIDKSPLCKTLFVAPGNGGMAAWTPPAPLDVSDHQAVIAFCQAQKIDFVVVGPEVPLVAGIVDDLDAAGIASFGPRKDAAQLEGSKSFTKQICDRANIPTAAYGRFTNVRDALGYLRDQSVPIVIKADGLAAGKGVTVALKMEEAEAAVRECFDGIFGEAGAEVVIEEFLEGEEASLFAICDGENAMLFGTAQDHKRAFDGDTGPNTGGMGAYSPAPVLTEALCAEVMDVFIQPTLDTLRADGMPFSGVLYAGLMITDEGPKLIEYNARFGDPEMQVLLMRSKSDILAIMLAAANGELKGMEAEWDARPALMVVMAAQGYPGTYEKGTQIFGELTSDQVEIEIFHAGTQLADGLLTATGGRVLNIVALGDSVSQAQQLAYAQVDKIHWPQGFVRRDIGWRAIEREQGD